MKKALDININKARIKYIGIDMKEDGTPDVVVRLQLLTADDREITTYDVSTREWNKDKKIDLPTSVFIPLGELVGVLERLAVANLNGIHKMIAAETPPKRPKANSTEIPF